MIVAIYKEQSDAAERAAREGGEVKPTIEAHRGVAERWPAYPWAVVRSPLDPGDAWAGRAAEKALAQ